MAEPYIQIGDHVLTEAQAMAVRAAINDFYVQTGEDEQRAALGPIADAYHMRLAEVLVVVADQTK